MKALMSSRALVLQALLHGPSHGLELTRRVQEKTGGLVRLSHGNLYAVLAALQRAHLVTSRREVPGGHRGARLRVRYELTTAGQREAVAQRRALLSLLGAAASTEPTAVVALRDAVLDSR